MRVLQINESDRINSKKIIEYAKKHIIDKFMAKLMIAGDLPCVGDNPDHVLHIHNGYRVVFSIEQHEILCNHISISVDTKGKYPNEHAVKMILELFGMNTEYKNSTYIYIEKKSESINIIQERKEK